MEASSDKFQCDAHIGVHWLTFSENLPLGGLSGSHSGSSWGSLHKKPEGPHIITDIFETVENSSIRLGWLTLGLLLIVDLRPLTFVAVLGLGVEGGRGTGVE